MRMALETGLTRVAPADLVVSLRSVKSMPDPVTLRCQHSNLRMNGNVKVLTGNNPNELVSLFLQRLINQPAGLQVFATKTLKQAFLGMVCLGHPHLLAQVIQP